ncbi:MAG: site-specific DNA-methyltransferase [Planctomycetes bacterium]|nr:site-specific DNA-methyltransferase [Planctomycetota bacterium]
MGTSTKSFGSSKRESHDSSVFNGRRILDGLRPKVNGGSATGLPIPPLDATKINRIYCKSSERMTEDLPENSVALVVTSPPYNVGKEYDNDLSLDEYLKLLRKVFDATKKVLEPGGRVCINIANVGRKPYIPLASYVNRIMLEELGYLMRGEILWVKGKSANGSCAWGSWRSAGNPVLRDTHEYILVYSKGQFGRARTGKSSIGADEFLNNSLSVWEMEPESASRVGHPAPFPEELPKRLIEFYTYQDDLVLDPFCGVGTTCVAAKKLNRNYVGYDIKQEYVDMAKERLSTPPPGFAEFQRRATIEGKGAQKFAESLLEKCGFKITARDRKLKGLGIQVSFVAEDKTGRSWYFDVTGAFTSQRAGLKRTDTVFKCLGRASVMAADDDRRYARLVLLTTDLPRKGSSGDQALRATKGRTFFDAIEIGNEQQESRLREYAQGNRDRPIEGFWRPGEYGGPGLAPGDLQVPGSPSSERIEDAIPAAGLPGILPTTSFSLGARRES